MSSRINIGQHPTHPVQVLSTNERSYEDGYDYQSQIGPFYDCIFVMEPISFYDDAVMDRKSILDTNQQTNNVATNNNCHENGKENGENKFTMTDVEIMAL